jgi:ABC-type transport system involved in multi-copper enzyme maturation permease subunit
VPRSATHQLVRDELIGFARARVMVVLWVVLPCIALAGFLLLRGRILHGARADLSAAGFMAFLEGSLASTAAGLMIAVDLVSERNRNVYTLLVIRPVRREVIVWAKFVAVFGCVAVACVVSIALGVVVDLAHGLAPSAAELAGTGRALVQMTALIALATAAGAVFGVLTRSIVVAVLLVLYVGQNVAGLVMLPVYLGVLVDQFWLLMALACALAGVVLWLAGRAFRRIQL